MKGNTVRECDDKQKSSGRGLEAMSAVVGVPRRDHRCDVVYHRCAIIAPMARHVEPRARAGTRAIHNAMTRA